MKNPLKAVDRRRGASKARGVGEHASGVATPLADLFSDRRKVGGKGHKNGSAGKRAK